jgi:PAS domain S-box-containing protein
MSCGSGPLRSVTSAGLQIALAVGQKTGGRDFLLLAEISPAMIWMSDGNGDCTYANWAWLKFRGRSLAQELGKGWLEAIHPDDLNGYLKAAAHGFRTREPFEIRYRAMRADGHYCSVQDIACPWFDSDSTTGGYLGRVNLLDSHATGDVQRLVSVLTPREREVLALVADGNATKVVAAILGISYKTADSHRTRIQKKLDLHDTASLVRFAVRSGLVP